MPRRPIFYNVIAVTAAALVLTGCKTTDRQVASCAAGGLIGTAIGVIAGSQIGDGGGRTLAMVLGGAAGGLAGCKLVQMLTEREQRDLGNRRKHIVNATPDAMPRKAKWRSAESPAHADIEVTRARAASPLLEDVRQQGGEVDETVLASLPSDTTCRRVRTSVSAKADEANLQDVWCRDSLGDYVAVATYPDGADNIT